MSKTTVWFEHKYSIPLFIQPAFDRKHIFQQCVNFGVLYKIASCFEKDYIIEFEVLRLCLICALVKLVTKLSQE